APRGRFGHRHRPAGDAPDQQPKHPGCDLLPAVKTGGNLKASGGRKPTGHSQLRKDFEMKYQIPFVIFLTLTAFAALGCSSLEEQYFIEEGIPYEILKEGDYRTSGGVI